jgi:hypothetical protein
MLLVFIQQASAETAEKSERFGCVALNYKVILPKGCDPAYGRHVRLVVENGQELLITTRTASRRLFEQLEEAAPGCN